MFCAERAKKCAAPSLVDSSSSLLSKAIALILSEGEVALFNPARYIDQASPFFVSSLMVTMALHCRVVLPNDSRTSFRTEGCFSLAAASFNNLALSKHLV